MGQIHSRLRSHAVVRESSRLVFKESDPPDVLEFDFTQSFLISFGIDKQTSPKFSHRSLSSIAGTDAESVALMFNKVVGIPAKNSCSFVASRNNADCTFDGIQKKFIDYANKVENNGVFIFHFTGHGLYVSRDREWGLVPADFDCTKETFITGAVLAKWLLQSRFQGRYVLLILDTCFSGGIGDDFILETVQLEIPASGIYVVTSCTANESSMVLAALGKSVFSYFLSSALFESYSQPGKLNLKELYVNCDACCVAFSSLLLAYDTKDESLSWKVMQPEFKQFDLPKYLQHLFQEDDEATDAPPAGRFAFVLCLYDYTCAIKKNPLPEKCSAWLDMVSNPNSGALVELKKRQLLHDQKILTAAIAAMAYSVASIFIASESKESVSRLSSPNIFIILLLHVLASVDKIHVLVGISYSHVRIALDYYMEALNKNRISVKMLKKLNLRLLQEEQNTTDGGKEFTDSGEAESCSDAENEFIPLCTWIPFTEVEELR